MYSGSPFSWTALKKFSQKKTEGVDCAMARKKVDSAIKCLRK